MGKNRDVVTSKGHEVNNNENESNKRRNYVEVRKKGERTKMREKHENKHGEW